MYLCCILYEMNLGAGLKNLLRVCEALQREDWRGNPVQQLSDGKTCPHRSDKGTFAAQICTRIFGETKSIFQYTIYKFSTRCCGVIRLAAWGESSTEAVKFEYVDHDEPKNEPFSERISPVDAR